MRKSHWSKDSYVVKAMDTVKLGLIVRPRTALKGISKGSKVVRLIEGDYVYLEERGKLRLTIRPTLKKTLCYHYEWPGKPTNEAPIEVAVADKLGTGKRKTGADNISPMWFAIKDVQARLKKLEDALGV